MTKLLFLPRCLREEQYQTLKEEGEKRGYEVTRIIGSSQFIDILAGYENVDVERIVGIACPHEVRHFLEEYTPRLKERGVEVVSFNLTKEKCKDTEANLEDVIGVL
jgi:hypothetical protein